jgi:hypothetical protein
MTKEINELCYDLLNMSGDKYINVIDLIELCAHFEP